MTIPERIDAANQKVLDIFTKAKPIWKDVLPAGQVVPGLTKNMVLIPGPPIALDKLPIPLKTAACGAAVFSARASKQIPDSVEPDDNPEQNP